MLAQPIPTLVPLVLVGPLTDERTEAVKTAIPLPSFLSRIVVILMLVGRRPSIPRVEVR